ncbi:beta-1,6-N-acetylglucosaminyltransferase [Dulcicalothrix desertica]|nr:beta-1,6-N-acetylglucosaminyltransferase [Dulcicalothrix desertica]
MSRLKEYSEIHLFNVITGRGDFSILREYLSTVKWILSNNLEFDWFVNLTGQDYPTQPISELENLLSRTSYDAYIQYFKVFSKEALWNIRQGCDRYLYKYYTLSKILPKWFLSLLKPLKFLNYLQPVLRIHFFYGLMIGSRVKSPFNDEFICYGGSYFCILSKKCLKYIHDFTQKHPDLLEHYKYVINPEESFIHTVLVNNQLFKLSNESKHYIDFSQSRYGSPATLTKDDYTLIQQNKYYFARKFDMNTDSTILDILDQTMLVKLNMITHFTKQK